MEVEYSLFLYNIIHPIFQQQIFYPYPNSLVTCGTGISSFPRRYYSPNILPENILSMSKSTAVELEYPLFL